MATPQSRGLAWTGLAWAWAWASSIVVVLVVYSASWIGWAVFVSCQGPTESMWSLEGFFGAGRQLRRVDRVQVARWLWQ